MSNAKIEIGEVEYIRADSVAAPAAPSLDGMSNETIKNEARISLSLLNAELDRFQAIADNAYIKYIGLCRHDGCLGWEIKVEKGWFGAGELQAHKAAAEELGRHRALQEMVNELRKLDGSNMK